MGVHELARREGALEVAQQLFLVAGVCGEEVAQRADCFDIAPQSLGSALCLVPLLVLPLVLRGRGSVDGCVLQKHVGAFESSSLALRFVEHLRRERSHLSDVHAERPQTRALSNLVQHCHSSSPHLLFLRLTASPHPLAFSLDDGADVQVPSASEAREFVEVRREESSAAQGGGEVARDTGCESEAVEGARASAQFVHEYQRLSRCSSQQRGGLEHLSHEGGHASLLHVSRAHASEESVHETHFAGLTGHETADVSEHGDATCRANVC